MPFADPEERRRYQREYVAKRRNEWIEENGPCAMCGSSYRLEVDHVDPTTKTMNPASIWTRRKEVREAELAKCQVLCYDCHNKKSSRDKSNLSTGKAKEKLRKLSPEQELEIVIRLQNGEGLRSLAREFGLAHTSLYKIIKRNTTV